MRIPNKINPDPILDAMLYIEYEKIEATTYSAILAEALKTFDLVEFSQNSNRKDIIFLHNQDYYFTFSNEQIILGHYNLYSGWVAFRNQINNIIELLSKFGLSSMKYYLRYINFFPEGNISEKYMNILFSIDIGDYEIVPEKNIRFIMQNNECIHIITLAEKAKIKIDKFPKKDGLVIDIQSKPKSTYEKLQIDHIDSLHMQEKVIFFGVIKDELLRNCSIEL